MVIALQTALSLPSLGIKYYIGTVVSKSLVRELSPVLTALIVGGRIGAGMTAEIGTMKVTEQIDALRSMAADPVKKLVVPKLVATLVMLPALTILGDFLGILGGLVIAVTQLDLAPGLYLNDVLDSLTIADVTSGIGKSIFFAYFIAIVGCYNGLDGARRRRRRRPRHHQHRRPGGDPRPGLGLLPHQAVLHPHLIDARAPDPRARPGQELRRPRRARRHRLRRRARRVPGGARALRHRQERHPAPAQRPRVAGPRHAWSSTASLVSELGERELYPLRKRMAMLFQGGALFDSMNVLDNVAYPLREHSDLDEDEIRAKVAEKLAMVRLSGIEEKMPADLSGGMKKRAALARSLALEPEVLLFDEPTTGLDPVTSATIGHLIRNIQRQLGVTAVVVTHDIPLARHVGDRLAFLSRRAASASSAPGPRRRRRTTAPSPTSSPGAKRRHGDDEFAEAERFCTGREVSMPRKRARPLRVGLLVVIAIVVLVAGILLIGGQNQLFTRKNEYYILFNSVSGLNAGNPVQLNGVDVGRVTSVVLPTEPSMNDIRVEIKVERRYASRVREDSQASIKTLGLLGDKYIELTSGSMSAEPIPDGGRIRPPRPPRSTSCCRRART